MKFLSAFIFLISMTISDSVDHNYALYNIDSTIMDSASQLETENDADSATEEKSKIWDSYSIKIDVPLEWGQIPLIIKKILLKSNPHQKIHSPPPR